MQPAQRSIETAVPQPCWIREIADAVTDPTELLEMLGLTASHIERDVGLALQDFPMRVPRHFVGRMQHGNPADPLLRQVLATAIETRVTPDFRTDPVGDLKSIRCEGLLQKYQGRALLMTTGACAIHCRFCFRRSFPYADQILNGRRLAKVMAEIASDSSLIEIILSGGDPLTLSDRRLAEILQQLKAIPHVRRIRIHTRTPIVVPSRVTPELLDALNSVSDHLVIVMHANHAAEIDTDVGEALDLLAQHCRYLLNQSVLLRGVNDSVDALCQLSEALDARGTLPYYLHQLDCVQGGAHFEVSDAEATNLIREVAPRLPGYLLPRLVREVHGEPFKQPVGLLP